MLSVFNNKLKAVNYILLWLVYGVAHFYVFSKFTSFEVKILLADSVIYTFLYAVTGVLLMFVLKYARLGNLNVFQRNLNYFGLCVIVITIEVGLSYLLVSAISENQADAMLYKLVPLRIFTSLLIFCLVISSYRLKLPDAVDELPDEINLPETEEFTANEIIPDTREYIDRIAVKTGQNIHVIPVHEIYCMKAESDYVHIFTEKGKYLKEQTMKFFEENLLPSRFVRVHRSYIVNVDAISRVELYEKQTQLLTLKNGMQIRMSQAGYKLLKSILKL
ncbi:MAG: LytTR family transcriptional regulator [Bacteroidia bacterium]|nr:LytTR family transcriptional regulator [Bacteroidia bacterium]